MAIITDWFKKTATFFRQDAAPDSNSVISDIKKIMGDAKVDDPVYIYCAGNADLRDLSEAMTSCLPKFRIIQDNVGENNVLDSLPPLAKRRAELRITDQTPSNHFIVCGNSFVLYRDVDKHEIERVEPTATNYMLAVAVSFYPGEASELEHVYLTTTNFNNPVEAEKLKQDFDKMWKDAHVPIEKQKPQPTEKCSP
ncbi:MAG: hypothetical protein CO093_04660 [Alphaproteobacteria bacterium CG_4_9_14_3_um_filter_47_13]|nr:MAG: hypothetical protein CO093_04660 [Alphaproteobacteria bacterium CG_4_9_14_3_um_filter_47_13]